MNEFKEKIKDMSEKGEAQTLNEEEFQKKIKDEVVGALLKMKTESKEEEFAKFEYILHLKQILENYKELEPVLMHFFDSRRYAEKFKKLNIEEEK